MPDDTFQNRGADGLGQSVGRLGHGQSTLTRSDSPRNSTGFSPQAPSQPQQRRTETTPTSQEALHGQIAPLRKRSRPGRSRAEVTYPRKRAITACRLCRSRKVKCSNARPVCGNCETSKATCVYEDSNDMSAFDPASILILERLEEVLTRLGHVQTVQTTSLPSIDPAMITPSTIQQESSNVTPSLDLQGKPDQDQESCDFDRRSIPSSRTTADAVLQWPIFGGCYPPNYITDAVFIHENLGEEHNDDSTRQGHGSARSHNRGVVLEEDTVLHLVQRFLDLVYPKNPILDVDLLWSYTESILESGLKWDSASCIVLLACALGCVATPFSQEPGPYRDNSSLKAQERDLREATAYYNLARRRFGLVEMGILSSQCHFLAGVYNMYTMRPLVAWSHFQSATKAYHLYLQCQSRRLPQAADSPLKTSQCRNLEQRLYWSCYKSECELRAEMNLPNSSLVDVHNDKMHPSPPVIDAGEMGTSPGDASRTSARATTHRQKEQTWFYYLTEITLRRIANRVLNILYPGNHTAWTEEAVLSMVHAVESFEQQLDEWWATLPAPIRSEPDGTLDGELPFHTCSRILQVKMWIYTPFLYFIIHAPATAVRHERVYWFADKALSVSEAMLHRAPTTHRHHGVWYSVQQTTSCCLFILGAVRRGGIPVPKDWRRGVETAIERMKYWEDEGPGVSQAIQVLTTYLLDI